MKPSLGRYFFIAFLAALILIASAIWILYRSTLVAQHVQRERTPDYAAQLLADQIAASIRTWARATQAIAQSPLALRILKTTDTNERRDLMATLNSLQPDLGEIQLVSQEQAQGQMLIPRALGAQQKRMIEKTHTLPHAGTALRAETLRLALSEPVRDASGTVVGYALVERTLGEISTLFAATPLIDGYAELQQINGVSDTLLKRGNEQLKLSSPPQLILLADTPWRLAVWRKPAAAGLAADLPRAYA